MCCWCYLVVRECVSLLNRKKQQQQWRSHSRRASGQLKWCTKKLILSLSLCLALRHCELHAIANCISKTEKKKKFSKLQMENAYFPLCWREIDFNINVSDRTFKPRSRWADSEQCLTSAVVVLLSKINNIPFWHILTWTIIMWKRATEISERPMQYHW